jgi:hypothetical protein
MVGDFKTYSKIEAIELHQKTGIHPHWFFNEDVFTAIDWRIEPTQTLEELYAIRAQQIREKYDYIVLLCSGGSDSINILNTFVNNKIHLDEVANMSSYEGDRDYHSFFNAEIYNIAVPKILKIQEKFPHIKHRVIDLSSIINELYNDPDMKYDFLYRMNMKFSPNNLARSFIRNAVSDYKDILASGKKLCFIWGAEKPRIFLENGKYCFKFLDILDPCVSPRMQMLNNPWEHDELFYWSPDLPQLIIKQAHKIVQFLRRGCFNPTDLIRESEAQFKSHGHVINCGEKFYLSQRKLHEIIYNMDNIWSEKSASSFFSKRDIWFLKNPNHSTGAINYMHGIEKLKSIVPDYWVNDIFYRDIKGCVSPSYYIE